MDWRRIRNRAVDATIAGETPTDARRADGRAGEPDHEVEPVRRFHRKAVRILIGALFVAGMVAAAVGKDGYLEVRRLRSQRDAAQALLDGQRSKVERLQRTVGSLESDPLALERIAREQLGLTESGEMTFVLTDPPGEGAEK